MMKLSEEVAKMETRADLVDFIGALGDDLENHPDAWENPTLPRFLDALARWIHSMDGYYRHVGQEPPTTTLSWRNVGDMLLAARIYE